MKIKSLVLENESLVPAEVEITLLSGLPQIQFLGLPDQTIRESVHRIKSAIKTQGFELPRAHQIMVNIRPNHLKKSSRGLELAVAVGILWKTEQIQLPPNVDQLIVYGELGLEGDVTEPEDLALYFDGDSSHRVLSGSSAVTHVGFHRLQISHLKQLEFPQVRAASEQIYQVERPQNFLQYRFSRDQARLLEVVALGGHSLLLAGPSGSGKTTLAKALSEFLKAPTTQEIRQIKKYSRSHGNWRPVVQPHHSSTPLALIGGGVPPARGEFARAHLGLLILDEFLEFNSRAQEILREPMEEGKIRLSRSVRVTEFPAKVQVIACTNLCPCGDWTPKKRVRCSRSLQKCRAYLNRLSGPLTDRFQVMFFTSKYQPSEGVLGADILSNIEKARAFQKSRAAQNADMDKDVLLKQMDSFCAEHLLPKEFSSRRRELSTLRVARSVADLDGKAQIGKGHLEEALDLCWRNFEHLKSLD